MLLVRSSWGTGDACDVAATVPVVEEALAKHVLANALDDEPLGLGGVGRGGRLVGDGLPEVVGQPAGELAGPAQEAVQGGKVGDPQRPSGAGAQGRSKGVPTPDKAESTLAWVSATSR